jgi:type II secretion system protein N
MQRIAIGAAALVLTLVFMYLRFPYERVAERIEAEVGRRTSWELHLIDPGPRPTLLGPGVGAGPVSIETPERSQEFEHVVIRPAWSPSWLALAPAFHLTAEAAGLNIQGTLTLGSPPHFEGELIDSDPRALLGDGSRLELSGRLDGDFSLALSPPAPSGPFSLTLRGGVLGHPLIPIQIPFDRFDAELEADAQGTLTIHRAELASPMLSGQAQGTLGMLPGGALDVNLDLDPSDDVRALLRAQGMRAGREGKMSLHLGGTASNPALR